MPHILSKWVISGVLVLCALIINACSMIPIVTPNVPSASTIYQERSLHDPDGLEKFYMGREIAQVMGHQGAAWLERSSRIFEEQPDAVISVLDLTPDAVVADIGAGTGYFSFRLAQRVPQGKVLAVDIQPEMLEIIDFLKQENQINNVEPVLGTETDPHLPDHSIDLALMVDAYHEFAFPNEMMQAVVKALKPDGRVVLVEYRGENPFLPIKRLHKMSQRQVKKEMQAVGLRWHTTEESLPQQHLMVFGKQSMKAKPFATHTQEMLNTTQKKLKQI